MNLVINSQFRPFTYDEMVKPLAQYKEVYDKIEQDYSDLTTQTEMWKDIVNQTNSPEAYEMYQRYANDLAAVTESFSRGMNINNRRALLGMKRRYAQDIIPIATADAAMKAANELRDKAGNDAIFEVGRYNSLDQFLHGKVANNKYQSRDALIKQTAAITEAAMAEAMKDPDFIKKMGYQYWMIKQHTGGPYEDLIEAMKLGIMDNPLAKNRFSQIRQEMLKKSGIERYDNEGQQAISNAIDLGLYAGLDKPTIQFQANQGYLNPLQQEQLRQLRSSGSDSGRGKSSESKEKEDSDYVANDVIYEIDENGKASVVTDMKPSEGHGYRRNIIDLSRAESDLFYNHIGKSDQSQYEIYTWSPSSHPKRRRVKINKKQSYSKPGPVNRVYNDSSFDYAY